MPAGAEARPKVQRAPTFLPGLIRRLARAFTAPEPTAYIPPSPQDRPAAPSSYALATVRA